MKITHIEFTKTFPVGVTWEKVMMAADIVSGIDSPEDCLQILKGKVEAFHKQSNPHIYKNVNEAVIHSYGTSGIYSNPPHGNENLTSNPLVINDDDKFKTVDGLRIPQAYAHNRTNWSGEKPPVINLQDEREYIKVEKEIEAVTSQEELAKYKEYCGKNPDLMPVYMSKMKMLTTTNGIK